MMIFQHTIDILRQNSTVFIALVTLISLCVGSFLNVVITRYPEMLKRAWQSECQSYLSLPVTEQAPLTLSKPDSRCPQCKHKIRAWHNIPLLSYIGLGGRCAYCKTRISALYPLVELITALLGFLIATHFGFSAKALSALLFTYACVALFVIDLQTTLLPDDIVLPLLWLGLLFNLSGTYTTIQSSVVGAIAGYCFLWCIAYLFKRLRGIDGMGHGDFKMLAMLGAWFGVELLFINLLIAVILSLVISLALVAAKAIRFNHLIPFGPFLAVAGWLSLMWPHTLFRLMQWVF